MSVFPAFSFRWPEDVRKGILLCIISYSLSALLQRANTQSSRTRHFCRRQMISHSLLAPHATQQLLCSTSASSSTNSQPQLHSMCRMARSTVKFLMKQTLLILPSLPCSHATHNNKFSLETSLLYLVDLEKISHSRPPQPDEIFF